MEIWTIKEWGILISLVFSFASLLLVVYKDFVQGAVLETVLNNLISIRLAEENKSSLLLQIILDDLLSGRPSDQANALFGSNAEIQHAVNQRNRELTKNLLINYSIAKSKKGEMIIYDANPESISKYFGDKSFAQSFYTPLNIVNTGRKSGDITTLILKISSVKDPAQKWMYSCFTEIKPDEFISFNNSKPFGSIIGKIFPGVNIGSNSNYRVDAFMIPIDSANDKIISRISLMPGKYMVQIVGYNSRNKKCLTSNIGLWNLTPQMLIDLFNGANIVTNISIENHIANEL